MTISLHKNLKIVATSDNWVYHIENIYTSVIEYLNTYYSGHLSDTLTYYDILASLSSIYQVKYINLPSGATFTWSSNGKTLSSNIIDCYNGQKIDYTLRLEDGSYREDSFIVSGDYTLDLGTIVPNKFILTITADKTLTQVRVYHNYTSGSTSYERLPVSANNIYTIECDNGENVRITSEANGWTEVPQTPDFMNISVKHHDYTNITSNISDSYNYSYESYLALRIFLKDENGEYVNMDNTYKNYITWNPSNSPDAVYIGITFDNPTDYYNIWKDKSLSISYTINVPNFKTITGTFPAQSSTTPVTIEHTETLVPMVTYTLNSNPSSDDITLEATGYTQSGHSITVPKGTVVSYTIRKTGYEDLTGTKTVNATESETLPLTRKMIQRMICMDPSYESYTDDGVTFTSVGGSSPTWYGYCEIIFDGEKFVTIGSGNTANTSYVASKYSYDGITWQTGPNMPLSYGIGNNGTLCYGNGKYVYGNYGYNVYGYSSDGINWNEGTWTLDSLSCGVFGNGKFIFINGNPRNKALISTDGENWTEKTLDFYPSNVSFANGYFWFSIQNVAKFYRSADLETFTEITLPTYSAGSMVAYNNGIYVADMNSGNSYLYSTDGINWTIAEISPTTISKYKQGVWVGHNKFYVACSTGTIFTSTNGITDWVFNGLSSGIYILCYGEIPTPLS